MRAKYILLALIGSGFAATTIAEIVTTDDGGLKVRPKAAATPVKGPLIKKLPTPARPIKSMGKRVTPAPRSDIVSSGEAILKATYVFDFDQGKAGSEGDLFYNHRDEVVRFLRPQNGATIALLPRADFSKADADLLRTLSYSERPINASDNGDNELRRGVLIGIKTRTGHFAKMRVTAYGRDLAFEWVTYR
jgi:hypothetical protein